MSAVIRPPRSPNDPDSSPENHVRRTPPVIKHDDCTINVRLENDG